jgi:membrane protease YdiL (CAAX protease family)
MPQPVAVEGDLRRTLTARKPDSKLAQIGRVALFVLGYITLLRVTSIAKGMVPPAIGDLTWGALASLSLIGLTWLMRRGQSTARSGSISAARVRQLLGGAMIGLSTYALTLAAIGLLVAPLSVSPIVAPDARTGVLIVAGFLALACMEELGFRGYPLRTLSAVLGTRTALLVVSLLFAASHVLFGWPWETILLGVLPSGILFGVAAVVSGGLAMPIGLHAAVNVAQWVAGEKSAPGFFTLALDPALAAQSARFTPFIGAAIPLVMAAALWRWYPCAAPMRDRGISDTGSRANEA